ncbi:MAG TPA: di-heme oxidoredictase family protein [Bacteroidia bacterium]|nr:di-heme oxidoredictase family protein [Bacteroidia bacterium]
MKKYIVSILSVIISVLVMYSCSKPGTPPPDNPYLSAGNETVFDNGSTAFGDDFPVISGSQLRFHDDGEAVFNNTFVYNPNLAFTGLGPVYNNSSCLGCHVGLGEGNPPAPGGPLVSMLFRISIPGKGPYGGPNPVPGYGGQLQNNAVGGAVPEGTIDIQYTNVNLSFADGTPYQLQIPQYTVTGTYTNWPSNALISGRVAPRLVGLGILEQIPENEILENVHGNLAMGDTSQINGKPNYVYDYTNQQMELGRFGWKCEAPSILQQTAGAYNQDMGVTNYVFPEESTYGQGQFAYVPAGDPSPELPDSELNENVFYVQTLAPPARRNVYDAQVVHGQQIFNSAGAQCASCHSPTLTTGVNFSFSIMSNLKVHAYTDMLLHDMGGGLADNRPTFSATGRQWRTAPLWGIGLVPLIDPQGQYLHDGRARTLMEAIMWHGGEAYNAKEYVRNLSAYDRDALIAFLQSL